MSRGLEEIKRDASTLTMEEQHELAIWLQDSVASEDDDLDEGWKQEVLRRAKDVEEGRVKMLDGEEVLARMAARLRR